VAGLGFMLPGFVLMFLLSWLYLAVGLTNLAFQAVFLGVQPAVVALIVRACHRIGGHSLTDGPLWAIGMLAAAGEALGVSFWITLPVAGLGYVVATARRWAWAALLAGTFALVVGQTSPVIAGRAPLLPQPSAVSPAELRHAGQATPAALFGSGLRAGLLTFGGAYTAIPFLKTDAVERGRWMSERDFLDGVALSGVLPAPLIIFSTFVGYFGGGPLGALAMTLGVFLPAFGFSLLFFRQLESAMANPLLRHFLEGVTAGVVGLIAITAAKLALTTVTTLAAGAIFVAALATAGRWKSRWAVPVIVFGAGAAGWLVMR
jgi:chromate transporter